MHLWLRKCPASQKFYLILPFLSLKKIVSQKHLKLKTKEKSSYFCFLFIVKCVTYNILLPCFIIPLLNFCLVAKNIC